MFFLNVSKLIKTTIRTKTQIRQTSFLMTGSKKQSIRRIRPLVKLLFIDGTNSFTFLRMKLREGCNKIKQNKTHKNNRIKFVKSLTFKVLRGRFRHTGANETNKIC